MKMSFKILRTPYRLDHSLFDLDFDNCLYLTNELIKNNELREEDGVFYKKLISKNLEKKEQERIDRNLRQQKYRKNRKRKNYDSDD